MKTLISIGIIGSLILVLMQYPDIINIVLGVKSMIIYALSIIYSELTIFLLFFEVAWIVAINLIRKL